MVRISNVYKICLLQFNIQLRGVFLFRCMQGILPITFPVNEMIVVSSTVRKKTYSIFIYKVMFAHNIQNISKRINIDAIYVYLKYIW